MIVLHAVAEKDGPALAPVADRLGLEAYDAHGLVVLHREQAQAPVPEAAAVLAFGEVLRALAAERTVLPMRFGSVLPGRDDLQDLVEHQHESWHDLLRALAGRAELIVHLPPPAPQQPAGSVSGRDYLTARAAAVHAEEERLAELGGLAAVEAVRILPRHRVSLLVDEAEADEARAQVIAWADARGWGDLAVTGPWPPFSFCEEAPR